MPLIRTHLSRRGGHRPEKKINAGDIDGHVRSLRLSIADGDLKYHKKADKRVGLANAGGEALSAIQLPAYNGPEQTTDGVNFGANKPSQTR